MLNNKLISYITTFLDIPDYPKMLQLSKSLHELIISDYFLDSWKYYPLFQELKDKSINYKMSICAKYNRIDLVKYFIETHHTANWNNVLRVATINKHIDIAMLMVENGATNIEECIELSENDEFNI